MGRPDSVVTSPTLSPAATASPTRRTGRKAKQAGGASRQPARTRASMPVSGRRSPSKMCPSRAGPTRTASGWRSPSMSVPGRSPVVSS